MYIQHRESEMGLRASQAYSNYAGLRSSESRSIRHDLVFQIYFMLPPPILARNSLPPLVSCLVEPEN